MSDENLGIKKFQILEDFPKSGIKFCCPQIAQIFAECAAKRKSPTD